MTTDLDRNRDLASSLDAEEALLPFLPQLLTDLWALGFTPEPSTRLLGRTLGQRQSLRVLDLGCGKGALLIHLAKELGWPGFGIDIVPEFIDDARKRAVEHGVDGLSQFECGDMASYTSGKVRADLLVFGFDSEALGPLPQTLRALRSCLEPGGHLLLDTIWSRAGFKHDGVLSEEATLEALTHAGYQVVDREILDPAWVREQNHSNTEKIRARALELAAAHPEHAGMFEDYVRQQEEESRLLHEEYVCVGLLLRPLSE